MALTVRRSDAERMQISYRNGFLVDLPIWAEGDTDHLVASELKLWLKQRARYDVQQAAAKFSRQFGLTPRSIRVADLAHGWGSCGQEDNVVVNWQLIFAPSRVLEYVVAHELAHLRHRNHEPAFWTYLEGIAPGWRSAKAWLDQHEGSLSADFLAIRTDRPEPVTA